MQIRLERMHVSTKQLLDLAERYELEILGAIVLAILAGVVISWAYDEVTEWASAGFLIGF